MDREQVRSVIENVLVYKYPEIRSDNFVDFVKKLRLHLRSGLDVKKACPVPGYFEDVRTFPMIQVDVDGTIDMLKKYNKYTDDRTLVINDDINVLVKNVKTLIHNECADFDEIYVNKSVSKPYTTLCGIGWTSFVESSNMTWNVEVYLTSEIHIVDKWTHMMMRMIVSSWKCLFPMNKFDPSKIDKVRIYKKIYHTDIEGLKANARSMAAYGLLRSDLCKSPQ